MAEYTGFFTFIRREIERMLRVVIQTLVTPWLSALLYIFVFGFVVGQRIDTIAGVSYIDFVLPGIVMMNVLTAAFAHTSSSLFPAIYFKSIQEILVTPLSHLEMMAAYMAGGMIRGIIAGLLVFATAVLFSAANVAHFWLLLFYMVFVSAIFSLLGIIVGMWAKGFEQVNIFPTFVITPLIFLGGVFYSLELLPEKLQIIAQWNPFFYFVDGIRYAMIGIREGSAMVGYVLIVALALILGTIVWNIFRTGWRLRG